MAEDTLTRTEPWSVREFRAMGSRCRIVAPTPELSTLGAAIVERLESSWTRFRPDSELSGVNAHPGHLCLVSDDLHAVLKVAERAHRTSAGRFDVRCLEALERAGYRTSWSDAGAPWVEEPTSSHLDLLTADGQFVLFDDPPAVLVPTEHRLDLGGIGKGFAADLVADELLAAGAERVQVELGGDIRVAGPSWTGPNWTVEVEDPRDPDRVACEVDLDDGAVATSSVLRRRWQAVGADSHHLIDVGTMRPAQTDLVAVTVAADRAWRAEVAAKCALIAGRCDAADVLASFGVRGLLFGTDGAIEEVET